MTTKGERRLMETSDESELSERPALSIDLAAAFEQKQRALEASYLGIRHVTTHPGTKGDELEADWAGLIRDFLPTRYQVGPIFAVDHTGASSEQIDVAVYDSHYSPQWFGGANGLRFVPAESVYAVFEVKPTLNGSNLDYAFRKVASVRNLQRTAAAVVHKGGRYEVNSTMVPPIIGGILTTTNSWSLGTSRGNLVQRQPASTDAGFLNIGIALDTFCFDYTPSNDGEVVQVPLTTSEAGTQLIHFAARLFRQLQALGTVPAIDMAKYERWIDATPEVLRRTPLDTSP